MSDASVAHDVPPPPYEEKHVEHAIHEAFLTPEVQNQIAIDIDKFTANTQKLAERFRVVKDKLEEIDNMKIENELLAPTWIALRDRYIHTVSESERIASDIAVGAEKYLHMVVKPAAAFHEKGQLSLEDLQDLNDEIQDFIKNNKKYDEDAHKVRADFTTLISDVKTFQERILQKKEFGSARQSENERKITEFYKRISVLQGELDNINAELKKAQDIVTRGKAVTDVMGTFSRWCPFASLIIFAVKAISLDKAEAAVADCQKKAARKAADIELTKDEIKQCQQENERIIAIRSTLRDLAEHEIGDVILCLDFFRALWSAIALDCHSIGLYMADLQQRTALMKERNRKLAPPALIQYLKNTTTLYHGLSRALSLYAMGIRDAKKGGNLSV